MAIWSSCSLAMLVQPEPAAAHVLADETAGPSLVQSDYERALTIGDRYGQLTVNVPEVPAKG
ncbi:hypothetical protein [Bradyrhizobium brasilense]|uniref:hypothetical protein n=1 Tax=Bradyrhizobium brasilense TaxID=1419277 RepID=UPI001178265E|nr:hypothetical protein [Bradyrhizobium brasilense]